MKRLILSVLAIVPLAVSFAEPSPSTGKPPITRDGFFKAIEIGGIPDDELITYLGTLGVSFRLTEEDRGKLTKAGVSSRIIETIDRNYRIDPEERAARIGPLSKGAALGRDELAGLLKSGIPSEWLEEVVEKRGVAFSLGPDVAQQLEAAGAQRSLIGLLITKAPGAPAPAQIVKQEPRKPEPAPLAPNPPKPQPEPVKTAAVPAPEARPPAANPAPQAAAPPQAGPPEADEDTLTLVRQVRPVYPAEARKANLAGVVRLKIVIAPDGSVREAETLEGHPVLAAAASDAVRKWVYETPRVNGNPAAVSTVVKINFKAP